MQLTARRERFCREYLVDLNGAQAAMRAGFAKSGARQEAARLLANADVQRRIAELQAQSAERIDCSIDDVTRMLLTSYREASAAKQFTAAVRAAELLGKRLGMFIDVLREDDPTPTPEEVRRRIAQLARDNPRLVDLVAIRAEQR